jgi:KEOPS complex subunit Cgi121
MRVVEGVASVDDVDSFLSWLDAIADDHGVTVQAFDARYVVGREHLARAVRLADRAIARGENVARERGVEILLYAAGRRQIDRALAMGIDEGGEAEPVVVLVDDPGGDETSEERAAAAVRERVATADTLAAVDERRVREFFSVTDAELAATDGDLSDVVCERIALLDVEK